MDYLPDILVEGEKWDKNWLKCVNDMAYQMILHRNIDTDTDLTWGVGWGKYLMMASQKLWQNKIDCKCNISRRTGFCSYSFSPLCYTGVVEEWCEGGSCNYQYPTLKTVLELEDWYRSQPKSMRNLSDHIIKRNTDKTQEELDAWIRWENSLYTNNETSYGSNILPSVYSNYDFEEWWENGRGMVYECDGCGAMPIVGVRYNRGDEDLCGFCYYNTNNAPNYDIVWMIKREIKTALDEYNFHNEYVLAWLDGDSSGLIESDRTHESSSESDSGSDSESNSGSESVGLSDTESESDSEDNDSS